MSNNDDSRKTFIQNMLNGMTFSEVEAVSNAAYSHLKALIHGKIVNGEYPDLNQQEKKACQTTTVYTVIHMYKDRTKLSLMICNEVVEDYVKNLQANFNCNASDCECKH